MKARLALAVLCMKHTTQVEANTFIRGGMTPCESRRWHIDIEIDTPGCSNSWKVPSSWTSSPHIESRMFYASADECCTELFEDGECNINDFCECKSKSQDGVCALELDQTVTVADHCNGEPKWHFNMDTKTGCTNSANYPEQWNNPQMAQDMFYDTPAGCCEKFLKRGVTCPVHDVCEGIQGHRNLKVNIEEVLQATENNTAKMPMHSA